VGYLNVREGPYVGADLVGKADHGAILGVLEDAEQGQNKVGQNNQWLWIRTPDNKVGYVAAWYVQLAPPPPPPPPPTVFFIVIDSPDTPLKLRSGPGTQYAILAEMPHETLLKALETETVVKQKVGKQGQWLNVQAPNGQTGYVAAWYTKLQTAEPDPIVPQPVEGPVSWIIVESPDAGLRVRQQPTTSAAQVWWVPHSTVLEVLEDPTAAGKKVGQQNQWIRVRTPSRREGFVAAWYVRAPRQSDTRRLATSADLPKGLVPHIFGVHAAKLSDDVHFRDGLRGLYNGKNKKGWIFFTETLGWQPNSIGLDADQRNRLWDWAQQGYGVIIRLSHGYYPSGTLPVSAHYDDFAATCARWVELYLKADSALNAQFQWTIQIGNEQNNPTEHPGDHGQLYEHITAELFAQAFNKVYAAIKAVLPGAVVCPGAIDPYNSAPMPLLGNARWRPLDYFDTMLDNIPRLDGFILHAYTHGPSVNGITSLATFGDALLGDHYFDFQTYRLFMERIPLKWRDLPVYLTETNHICRPDAAPNCTHNQGWINQNIGWVRAMYTEINRWNQQPYAQQIRCALLYRWAGDDWLIHDKPEIQADFRQALDNDYRWLLPAPELLTKAIESQPVTALMEAPVAAPQPPERTLVAPDNLKRIWSIGVKIEAALNAAGIYLFEQLAALEPEDISNLLGEMTVRVRYSATWSIQARLLVQQRKRELLEYQRSLGRGRAR
jgi:predicted flap endonuclease-1-like 5' DNA nuclease